MFSEAAALLLSAGGNARTKYPSNTMVAIAEVTARRSQPFLRSRKNSTAVAIAPSRQILPRTYRFQVFLGSSCGWFFVESLDACLMSMTVIGTA